MKRLHAHPVAILGNLWRMLYLIVIPVLRGFFAALQDDPAAWISGAWMDVLILLLMTAVAVLRWRAVELWRDRSVLHIRAGVALTTRTMIPWNKVVTVSVTRPFYLRPARAVRLRVDTMGGSLRNSDFTVLLSPADAELLLEQEIYSRREGFKAYSPSTRSILALSMLNSNAPAGVAFIAAFISQSGRLLGVEFSRLLLDTFEETARALAFGIPPAAAAIAYLLLAGWAVSFYLSFLRYKNMRVSCRDGLLRVAGGSLTYREYLVRYRDINFIDIRQSLTTRAMGLYSLYISAVGYGKRKEDISCLIPTESEKSFALNRRALFPELSPAGRTLPARREGVLRFLAQPLCLCLGIPALTAATVRMAEGWASFALFAGLMAMIPAAFFTAIRLADYRTGGAARKGDAFTLRYSKGLYLHTVVVEKGKIAQTELLQSPWQRLGGTCDLLVRTRGEGRILHRCRAVNLAQARELFA